MNVFLFVVAVVILAMAIFLPARDGLARIFLAIIAIAILGWGLFIGFNTTKIVVTEKETVTTLPAAFCEPVSCTPVACEPVEQKPVPVCDPSSVPFVDMGELNPNVETVIVGPAIYEWWIGGELEGVQRVEVGYTVTIHGAKGHWWTLPSQAGLDCAWKLHVGNYAANPQHAEKTIAQLIISPPVDLIK